MSANNETADVQPDRIGGKASAMGTHDDIDTAMRVIATGTRDEARAVIQTALDRCHPRNKRTTARLREALDMIAAGDGPETVQHRVAQAGTDMPFGNSNAWGGRPVIMADQTCTECGSGLVTRARFCTNCGTQVGAGTVPSRAW